jgi:hypothetical protein
VWSVPVNRRAPMEFRIRFFIARTVSEDLRRRYGDGIREPEKTGPSSPGGSPFHSRRFARDSRASFAVFGIS